MPGEDHIHSHEQDGLPGTTDLERYSRNQAKSVVRTHTRKGSWGFGWLGHHGWDKARPGEKRSRSEVHANTHSDTERDPDTDVEAMALDNTSNTP